MDMSGGALAAPGVFENAANGVKTERARVLRDDFYGNFRCAVEHGVIQAKCLQARGRADAAGDSGPASISAAAATASAGSHNAAAARIGRNFKTRNTAIFRSRACWNLSLVNKL